MANEKLLTVREAAAYLRISEKAIVDLSEQGIVPAYKVGGVYLRFKRDQLDGVKNSPQFSRIVSRVKIENAPHSGRRSLGEKINDFVYYNDFYFLCLAICLLLLFIVFNT